MINYLLDTCLILGLFKGNEQALTLMATIPPNACAVSTVNRIELLGYHNITDHDLRVLSEFLDNLTILPLSPIVENMAIQVRQRHKIKLADSIVLATALSHQLQLITLDNGLNNKYLLEKTTNFKD